MLFLFNFFIAQWTSYRLGRIFLTKDRKEVGWAIIGPLVPLTGFGMWPLRNPVGLLGDHKVNVMSLYVDEVKDLRPMVDWKVRTM